jgi:flagellum-specific peptidoglycan hydrolase FlgJ
LAKKHLFEKDIYKLSLTPELFIKALYFAEVIEPEIVLKQALIETGHFTSDMLWRNNNVFGMRLARVRETTAVKQMNYHAYYDHWYDSVKDYKLLQEYYISRGRDLNNYYSFLREIGYATDPNYILKLKSVSDIS